MPFSDLTKQNMETNGKDCPYDKDLNITVTAAKGKMLLPRLSDEAPDKTNHFMDFILEQDASTCKASDMFEGTWDKDNQGYHGITLTMEDDGNETSKDNLRKRLPVAVEKVKPDWVFLMIGTNDIARLGVEREYDATTEKWIIKRDGNGDEIVKTQDIPIIKAQLKDSEKGIRGIVDEVLEQDSNVQILLATLIPFGNTDGEELRKLQEARNEIVRDYNEEIKKFDSPISSVDDLYDPGRRVHVVDMYSVFGPEEVKNHYADSDPYHPKNLNILNGECVSGYDLMAAKWFEAFSILVPTSNDRISTSMKQVKDFDFLVDRQEKQSHSSSELGLSPAYPNPFNPTTMIQYSLPAAMEVRLVVYDVLGREVALLVEGAQSAGHHTATFDATNLSNGLYLYTLQTPAQTLTGRMLLMK